MAVIACAPCLSDTASVDRSLRRTRFSKRTIDGWAEMR